MDTRQWRPSLSHPGWPHRLGVASAALSLVLGQALFIGAGPAAASLSPASATLTITAGSSGTETKTVGVPAVPPKADIELAIDTTGSMDPSINQAKADAMAIVSGVQGVVADTDFAVVSFKDGNCTDGQTAAEEYQVLQSMTANATDVNNAITGLPSASGGCDLPEAHNLVFHNSYNPPTGGDLGWRSGTRKFVVVISDAQPHGAGSAGFAGCTDTSGDPNGLNTATELAGMAAAERTLLMIRQVSSATSATLGCYQSLAAASFTGGDAVDGGGSLATQIVNLITAAFANVNDVHLQVVSATPAPASASWISFSPTSVGPVPAPSTQTFTLTAAVPSATPGGTYVFDIEAVADDVDIGHQTLTIDVNRATSLVYNGDTTQDYHDQTTLAATLTDSVSSAPISGQTVDFTLGSQTCSDTTNASGNASCNLVLNQVPGPYTVTASFAGTATLVASADSAKYVITKEETTTTYTGPTVIANGVPTTLSGVLKEDGSVPIAGRTLTLTLGTGSGAQSCVTGATDATGTASCSITPAQPLGPGTVKAAFLGDSFYLPSSDSATTTVFAFLATGAFVIGDGNRAIGTSVTFWGAQWAKSNTLSGGGAPNQFKGFAGTTPEPPVCGTGWTTDPGNSTPPPAGPLPSYMGVIVSSSISNAGSTISGDTVHIVVVRTGSGYAANPGHAGTGTVVATYC